MASLGGRGVTERGRLAGSKAVFLDRDGVINRNIVRNGRPYAPARVEEFVLLPGVPEAAAALRDAGYLIIVATNQPDLRTGKQTQASVDLMHEKMRQAVHVDDIEVCGHTDQDNCGCRKPKPGMLFNAARKHDIDLAQSWMIGDRWRDVEAGRAAGCHTIFVDYGYPAEPRPDKPDAIVRSLVEAVPIILRK